MIIYLFSLFQGFIAHSNKALIHYPILTVQYKLIQLQDKKKHPTTAPAAHNSALITRLEGTQQPF